MAQFKYLQRSDDHLLGFPYMTQEMQDQRLRPTWRGLEKALDSLKDYRKAIRYLSGVYSAAELADLIGVSKSSVYRWRRGEQTPNWDKTWLLIRIAQVTYLGPVVTSGKYWWITRERERPELPLKLRRQNNSPSSLLDLCRVKLNDQEYDNTLLSYVISLGEMNGS